MSRSASGVSLALLSLLASACSGEIVEGATVATVADPTASTTASLDGNRCDLWGSPNLNVNPLHRAPHFSDLDTAYAGFMFFADPRIKLVLRGSFPSVRSVAFQSSSFDPLLNLVYADAVMDDELAMDPGSVNPFVPGNPINASPRAYTLEYVPAAAPSDARNVLRMGPNLVQVLDVRLTAPNQGALLSKASLPTITAHWAATGLPAPCPSRVTLPVLPSEPVVTCSAVAPAPPSGATSAMAFYLSPTSGGAYNSAVPAYVFSDEAPMACGQVAVVKVKAPSFANTHPGVGLFPANMDTRYWSFSAQDPGPSWPTIGTFPDWMTAVDASGEATFVIGPASLADLARQRNHNFIPDERSAMVGSILVTVRNMLPSAAFWPGAPQGAPANFPPRGVVCDAADYLAGACEP